MIHPTAATTFLAVLAGGLILATAVSLLGTRPEILLNTTPSEPLGFYARVGEAPAPGRIVAFWAPPSVFAYADGRLNYLHRVPLLKAIAAGPGDRVCTTTGRLVVNDRDLAPVVIADAQGRALPRWIGCRALGEGEVFVFSARVPNSFDSRYFGPVPTGSILGVFTPVLQFGEGR